MLTVCRVYVDKVPTDFIELLDALPFVRRSRRGECFRIDDIGQTLLYSFKVRRDTYEKKKVVRQVNHV
jgi:hypothetical protein